MFMAIAAATKVPFPASESVSDRLSLPQLRSGNNVSQPFTSLHLLPRTRNCTTAPLIVSCLPSPGFSKSPSTKLFVSGLSFRSTEESLRKAFKNFGQLLEVNLVMDKVANRPKGFAFIQYAAEEESQKAIEGMHGKFLDGRVIFVEVARSKSELRRGLKQDGRKT
ncbi:hypothetical protein M9H77_14285 [Catharanthus roseus]|uniref:Uncharacterized protein n=1 Tax=Catharanthus roseus TaxID=4058 RepID=A0ACC0BMM0_CATRO|nr:hypothetical protein M9H77_14285 [Catharanthus roseus]